MVDIVREHDRTTMYDIKTHDPEFIEANKDFYQQQLNVYAYIWQNLRAQGLMKRPSSARISPSIYGT